MRKKDPRSVRSEFKQELARLSDHYDRMQAYVEAGDPKHRLHDRGQLACSTFIAAFTEFEGFVSNLFLAYLNKDFSIYRSWLQSRFDASVKRKFGDGVLSRATLKLPQHLNLPGVREVVDSEGWNLTFKNADAMIDRAKDWLATAHADRVSSLDAHDKRLFDTAIAIRNYIAHGSDNAHTLMNEKLGTVDGGGPNAGLGLGRGGRKVNDAGKFLKKQGRSLGGDRMCSLYLARLETISQKL
jgi:hypothetical protein